MYCVDTIVSKEDQASLAAWVERKYNTEDYHIHGDDVDVGYAEKTCIAFHEDTGIDLKLLLDFLSYMQLGLIEDTQVSEQLPNVFSIDRHAVAESYIKRFSDNPPYVQDVDAIIDFITLNELSIKTVNGKTYGLLPIWERKKRDNRIEVKPIIIRNGNCVFSPVLLHTLELMWRNGIMDWFLPYEVGLSKTKSSLTTWKKYYEDAGFGTAGLRLRRIDMAKANYPSLIKHSYFIGSKLTMHAPKIKRKGYSQNESPNVKTKT